MTSRQGRRRLFAEPTENRRRHVKIDESKVFGVSGVELFGEVPTKSIYEIPTTPKHHGNANKTRQAVFEWMTVYCCDEYSFAEVKEWCMNKIKAEEQRNGKDESVQMEDQVDETASDQLEEQLETIEGPNCISIRMNAKHIDAIMKEKQPIKIVKNDEEENCVYVFLARGKVHEFLREDCKPISNVDPRWVWQTSPLVKLILCWILFIMFHKCF